MNGEYFVFNFCCCVESIKINSEFYTSSLPTGITHNIIVTTSTSSSRRAGRIIAYHFVRVYGVHLNDSRIAEWRPRCELEKCCCVPQPAVIRRGEDSYSPGGSIITITQAILNKHFLCPMNTIVLLPRQWSIENTKNLSVQVHALSKRSVYSIKYSSSNISTIAV